MTWSRVHVRRTFHNTAAHSLVCLAERIVLRMSSLSCPPSSHPSSPTTTPGFSTCAPDEISPLPSQLRAAGLSWRIANHPLFSSGEGFTTVTLLLDSLKAYLPWTYEPQRRSAKAQTVVQAAGWVWVCSCRERKHTCLVWSHSMGRLPAERQQVVTDDCHGHRDALA